VTCPKWFTQFLKEKKLSYHREAARCAISVEILSTAALMYEKSHLKRKRLAVGE